MADDDPFQAARYAFHPFHALEFEADIREYFADFFRRHGEVKVIFEPIQRDFHKRDL
jgi:hypothetical protein